MTEELKDTALDIEVEEWAIQNKDFSFLLSIGRPSNFQNEDDYDYAIELKPDDEYR